MTHLRGEQGDGVRRRSRSLALQDDYVYWAKHGERSVCMCGIPDPVCIGTFLGIIASSLSRLLSPLIRPHSDDSGKVLIVDDPAGGSAAPRQIFFDDNIERLRPHIVDARDLRTGKPLTFHGDGGTHGRQLVKVDPLQAVLDVDYFVRALHAAEERM